MDLSDIFKSNSENSDAQPPAKGKVKKPKKEKKAAEPKVEAATPVVESTPPPPPPTPSPAPTPAPAVDPLQAKAQAAAEAYDSLQYRESLYKVEHEKLMAEVEKQLEALKREFDAARAASEAASAALLEAMDKDGVSRIKMEDRKDIEVKVLAGRKKSITKTWLTEEFGNQQANAIWDKVPCNPDRREVVIPPRFDDQPNL